MRVADYIAKFLSKNKVSDIFMLTGYGSMYMNDAIHINNIRHIAPRNEATAPVMAIGYSKIKKNIGVVCVTAGPGSTNALPGLAEAYVESAPVFIISGQVERKFTSSSVGLNLRTYGTAEINIIKFVKNHTKYSSYIDDPKLIKFELEKALYYSLEGRPGPVWLDIPLDVQSSIINEKSLESFYKPKDYIDNSLNKSVEKIIKKLKKSKKPLFVFGNGVKLSNTISQFYKIAKKNNIPFCFTRFSHDLIPFSDKNNLGLLGEKGQRYSKIIFEETDFVISLGSRLSPTFSGDNYNFFFPNAEVAMVDIDKVELEKFDTKKVNIKVNTHLNYFLPIFKNKIEKEKFNFKNWLSSVQLIKHKYPMLTRSMKGNPIDLYNFMSLLDKCSDENCILVTDAGSNYYIGGQAWYFEKGQREISSTSNAAMGISLPLAIGSAVADKSKIILAVTGDGSIELNIQELKTMSHYNLNIKLFVINNGGYASMRNWQDNFGEDRRLDTDDLTGVGTLNFKDISRAFNLDFEIIDKSEKITTKINKIMKKKGPCLVEVVTKIDQIISIPYEL